MPRLLSLRETAAAVVAVALSAVLILVVLAMSGAYQAQATAGAEESLQGAQVVALSPQRAADHAQLSDLAQALESDPAVGRVVPYTEGTTWLDRPGQTYDALAFALQVPSSGDGLQVMSGRLPTSSDEVAVSETFAKANDVAVGQTIPMTASPSDTSSVRVQVVGVVVPRSSAVRRGTEMSYVFATPEGLSALGVPDEPAVLYLRAAPGTSAGELLEHVRDVAEAHAPDVQVLDAQSVVSSRVAVFNGSAGSAALELLRVLIPVCVVASGLVIASTFGTLVVRQRRMIGLLRCLGASRAQVRRSVLRAGLESGGAGGILGCLCGALTVLVLARLRLVADLDGDYLRTSPEQVGTALGAAVLITLVAVAVPARTANHVPPLIALTQDDATPPPNGRTRLLRLVLGLLLCAVGAAGLGLSVPARSIPLCAAAAAATVLGVIALLPAIARTALGGTAHVLRSYPVVGLAASNLARNPRRTASATAAPLVSVTVAAAAVTGLSGVRSGMSDYLDQRAPVDVVVAPIASTQLDEPRIAGLPETDGVAASVLVSELTVHLTGGGADEDLTVRSIDRDAVAPVIRSEQGLGGLSDETLVLGGIYDLPEGTHVTLTGTQGSVDLTVHVQEGGFGPVITPRTAQRLDGAEAPDYAMFLRTVGDGSDGRLAQTVRSDLSGSGLVVDSKSDGRRDFTDRIDRITSVVVGVFALTLLIGLSGLANTMRVSVIERTREIGVLRAIGSQRSQVRRLLLTEAVLIAFVGGILGVLLGVGTGIAGTLVLLGESTMAGTVSVPALKLLLVLVAAGAVGALAAWQPAGQASRVPATTAMAQD